MSFIFVRQVNKAHRISITANESSHCDISTLHKRSISSFLRFFQKWVASGLFSHRLAVVFPGFWKTLRSYITSRQNSSVPQHFCTLLSLFHHNDALWLSSQDLRRNYHQNVSLHNFSKASSTTSQQHSPPQFSHTVFTSHCTHATLFPALCFNILIFDNTSFHAKGQRLDWTILNIEPNPFQPLSHCSLKCSSPHHQLPLILYTTDLPSLHNLHNFHVFVYIRHLVCS